LSTNNKKQEENRRKQEEESRIRAAMLVYLENWVRKVYAQEIERARERDKHVPASMSILFGILNGILVVNDEPPVTDEEIRIMTLGLQHCNSIIMKAMALQQRLEEKGGQDG
jgi:hypothetical protein